MACITHCHRDTLCHRPIFELSRKRHTCQCVCNLTRFFEQSKETRFNHTCARIFKVLMQNSGKLKNAVDARDTNHGGEFPRIKIDASRLDEAAGAVEDELQD
jgi:hypothetical protein